MRAFFQHYGSKWMLAGRVPRPRGTIIEPFAGGAGYSTRHGAGRKVLLLDTDPDVVLMWNWLFNASPEDVLRLPVQPVHEGVDVRTLGLDRAPMLLIQRWLTPQGSNSNWRMTPMCQRQVTTRPGAFWSATIQARIAAQLPLIRRWEARCADYTTAPDIDATWHIDPPYQHNKAARAAYPGPPLDYAALGEWCRTRRGLVMVHEQSGADWLPFHTLNAKAMTGKVGSGARQSQHEVMWIKQRFGEGAA